MTASQFVGTHETKDDSMPYIVTTHATTDSHPKVDVIVSRVAVATLEEATIDLGGPDGGRYWLVVTDHATDELGDAWSAAVHARVTGSVGATYNGARVVRLTDGPLPEQGGTVSLPDGTVIEVERVDVQTLHDRCPAEFRYGRSMTVGLAEIIVAYNEAQQVPA